MNHPIVSVVLGSYNRGVHLRLAIESIRAEVAEIAHEIIVVDGGSTDGSLKWLIEQRDVITIVQHNRGFWRGRRIERKSWGYFMNLAFKSSQGKYICMLSDDCLVVPGAIREGLALFETRLAAGERVGAVAFYMRNWPEETKYYIHYSLDKTISVDHGLYLKAALEHVGYIDEHSYIFYYGDIDLALKLWEKGYAVVDSPLSYIEHSTHADVLVRRSNYQQSHTDFQRFKEKWSHILPDTPEDELHKKIEREYVDPYETARILSLSYQLRRGNFVYAVARLKRKIRIRERLGLVDTHPGS